MNDQVYDKVNRLEAGRPAFDGPPPTEPPQPAKGGLSPRNAATLDMWLDELLESKVRGAGLSLDKAQELILKRQQREIQRLQLLLDAERRRSNELTDRWAEVRVRVGAATDDTVPEVMALINPPAVCIYCAQPFQRTERSMVACPKCLETCKSKDGRP